MKLEDYVTDYANMLAGFDKNDLREYMWYMKTRAIYYNFERRILLDLYYRVNEFDRLKVCDKIRENGIKPTGNQIFRMMKAAFHLHFGCDVNTFLTAD